MRKLAAEIIGMFRGSDRQLSERRVFAFALLIGIIRYVEHANPIDNAVLMTLCGTMLLLLAVITWQNVKEFKTGNVPHTDETNPKT